MSDFAGKWKAAQGAGRMIVERIKRGEEQTSDAEAGDVDDARDDKCDDLESNDLETVYCAVVADGTGDSIEYLDLVVDEFMKVARRWNGESDAAEMSREFAAKLSSGAKHSHLAILLGTTSTGENGITGCFSTTDTKSSGDFVFLLQDENAFVGSLTSEPSLFADGWWMRQNIRRVIRLDDFDEYE